jgi:uncharacterized protein
MSKSLILSLLLSGAGLFYSVGTLAADPSVHEIYAAAEAGHIGQAEQMVDQVVKDNPGSGKAHYVAAEIYARAGNFGRARSELATAQQIDPGLPFANPASVSALQREVNASHGAVGTPQAFAPAAREHQSLPWGTIIFVVLAIAVVWAFVRRRTAAAGYPYSGAVPPGPGQPGYGGSPMGGPMGGGYYPGGGSGSGLMGSLGTGLAIGAGVAAGEELVHHVLDHNESGGIIGNAGAGERDYVPPENSNMGGDNFGVNDAGSWNDSGDAGSFDSSVGGDDWT